MPGDPDAATADAPTPVADAAPDAVPPPEDRCDVTKPFGEPRLLPNLNHTASSSNNDRLGWDVVPKLTPDELTIVFQSNRPNPAGGDMDIWIATRDKATDDFRAPKAIDGLNTAGGQWQPSITPDRLFIYYLENTATNLGDVFLSKRDNVAVDFKPGNKVAGLTTDIGGATDDGAPHIAIDDSLYFSSTKSGSSKIYQAIKNSQGAFETVELVKGIESQQTESDTAPVLSHDGKEIYWASTRTDGGHEGEYDVWHAVRDQNSGPFRGAERVDILSSAKRDMPGWLSKDGCVMYMERGFDLVFAVKPR